MQSVPECDLASSVTVHVELVGVDESAVIPICGAEEQQCGLTGVESFTMKCDVAREGSGESLDWRVVTEELLDSRGEDCRVGCHLVSRALMVSEDDDTVGKQVRGGLMAGNEK
ncbi:MAG: hypothetical protein NVS3B1_02860 [Marmoricola sp.]